MIVRKEKFHVKFPLLARQARTRAPVQSVTDLIALAKSRPGQLTFGAASGRTPHMAGELFKLMAGVDLLFVP